MPSAQSTFPAIDMLVLTFLVGFGLAAAVFVPLLLREHRRSGRRAARSRRSSRTRPGASPTAERAPAQRRRSPESTSSSEAREQDSSPEDPEREADGEEAPEARDPQESPSWQDAERSFGTTTSRWEKRVELCAADCAVRFGRARARLLSVTRELGIE
ncbi:MULTISPECIES: hypothetical protein [unclassified Actinopolyspora]|uniref:hypothetical protein n=1 Tax=unclassified Actinopolyspora TaxID=2639451 RepID=UPI0013F656B1|nr:MULTISPECIES: hypothetical protein [unclassified Actinopolyspora]NHD18387.1 hypothetical protein [Actinopolyspora sp. BKK2]NHE77654.1 hypothetical protein [Actinopolyspora sp. BKK1]